MLPNRGQRGREHRPPRRPPRSSCLVRRRGLPATEDRRARADPAVLRRRGATPVGAPPEKGPVADGQAGGLHVARIPAGMSESRPSGGERHGAERAAPGGDRAPADPRGLDPLQDWQRRYYEALREAGVQARMFDYPEAIHAFYIFPKSQESREFMSELKSFMEEHGRGL
ncbi:hypothetical protein EJ110_NYTH44850 [Nymphaea thermarum]|nr:hypothetical protein EJ110_NYTH44850 [Nymphaea thermarum]